MIETNKDKLLKIAVMGEIIPSSSGGYFAGWDGTPRMFLGMGGIKYNLRVGDPCYGWPSGDHVEPGVTIQGKEKPSPSACALAMFACIGNEAKLVSGDAKGEKGVFTGRHAGSDDLVWFPEETLEKLAFGDKVQIKAYGVGLKIKGFEDVRVNKCSPKLLENMGIKVEGGQLVVPVAARIPGFLMGSGIGSGQTVEPGDYDIMTTDPATNEKYNLHKLRLGDIVLLEDQLCVNGRGYYKGASTIGVIIHGWSEAAGHGPGVNPLLSSKDGRIKTVIDPRANTARYLSLRDDI